jgi:hypothetical protein
MSQDKGTNVLTVLLDAIGGEPLAGSGLEKEDPEQDFSITEDVAKE